MCGPLDRSAVRGVQVHLSIYLSYPPWTRTLHRLHNGLSYKVCRGRGSATAARRAFSFTSPSRDPRAPHALAIALRRRTPFYMPTGHGRGSPRSGRGSGGSQSDPSASPAHVEFPSSNNGGSGGRGRGGGRGHRRSKAASSVPIPFRFHSIDDQKFSNDHFHHRVKDVLDVPKIM